MAVTGILHELKSLTTKQRSAVIAALLGWTLDAFDFFIAVFVLSNIAHDFNTTVKNVAFGITLMMKGGGMESRVFPFKMQKGIKKRQEADGPVFDAQLFLS
jgi:hypothetical protein